MNEYRETKYSEDEIDLREIFKKLKSGKKLIALVTVLAIVAALAITYLSYISRDSVKTVKTVIAYNYDGAEDGVNPSGGKLDTSKIKAPFLLSRALDKVSLSNAAVPEEDPDRQEDQSSNNITPTVSQLRNAINIAPIIPGRIAQRITNARQNDEEYSYFPTEYVINFNIPKSLQITEKQGREIMDALVAEYIDYFRKYYSEGAVFANVLKERELDEYDYPQMVMVLDKQINDAVTYLQEKNRTSTGGSFRADSTGLSFSDIIASLKLLQDMELNRMSSLISSYNLTKDRNMLVMHYEQRIKDLNLKKDKKEAEAKIAIAMMTNFKEKKSTILVPGMPEAILLEDESGYYDRLARKATEAGVEAENKSLDIQYFQRAVDRFKTDTVTKSKKNDSIKKVSSLRNEIQLKLSNIIDKTFVTVNEFYDRTMGRAVVQLAPAEVYSGAPFPLKKNGLIGLAAGLFLGVMAVFLKEFFKNLNSDSGEKSRTEN